MAASTQEEEEAGRVVQVKTLPMWSLVFTSLWGPGRHSPVQAPGLRCSSASGAAAE